MEPRTKIMSWNVNMFLRNTDLISRGEDILRTIIHHDPDICFLQEVSKIYLKEIENKSCYTVTSYTKSHCGLTAILVKSHVKLNVIRNDVGFILADFNGTMIANCHFDNNQDYRRKQLMNLKIMNPNIIIGDLNFKENESIDGYDDLGIKEQIHTWNHSFFVRGSKIKKRFDRVYTNVAVDNFRVLNEWSGESDHVPIMIEIIVRNKS